jgi:hypothetical protein
VAWVLEQVKAIGGGAALAHIVAFVWNAPLRLRIARLELERRAWEARLARDTAQKAWVMEMRAWSVPEGPAG